MGALPTMRALPCQRTWVVQLHELRPHHAQQSQSRPVQHLAALAEQPVPHPRCSLRGEAGGKEAQVPVSGQQGGLAATASQVGGQLGLLLGQEGTQAAHLHVAAL
jgi:hypothetical protein